MRIISTERVSPDCIKIAFEDGPVFFIRKSYLSKTAHEHIAENYECGEEEFSDIVEAGLSYAAEMKAVNYLSRAEQSRFLLSGKLFSKKIAKKNIEAALDYLEKKELLSDARFAQAFLQARKINHTEGAGRLRTELAKRGIEKNIAEKAVADFFAENDENELCKKALLKCFRQKMSEEKTNAVLYRSGFSKKTIRAARSDLQ